MLCDFALFLSRRKLDGNSSASHVGLRRLTSFVREELFWLFVSEQKKKGSIGKGGTVVTKILWLTILKDIENGVLKTAFYAMTILIYYSLSEALLLF